MTDQALIDGLQKRDRAAIHYLVDHFQSNVIKTAYYFLHDMAEAEDLSQEIMVDILSTIDRFNQKSTLSTWIYRITVNRSLNKMKQLKRRQVLHSIEDFFRGKVEEVTEESIDQPPLEQHEQALVIQKAIDQLPQNQRIAFVLSKFDQRSYKEISEVMNITLSAVESLIHRAKINLQKELIHEFPEYN